MAKISEYKKKGKRPIYLKATFLDERFKPIAKEHRISLEYLAEACLNYGARALQNGEVYVALKDGVYSLEEKED